MESNLISQISLPVVTQRHHASANKTASTEGFGDILNSVTPYPPSYTEAARNADRLIVRASMTDAAKANPAEGKKLALFYAQKSLVHELLDLSDRPNVRYSATGELVTPQSKLYFAEQSLHFQKGLMALYNSEVAKGTHPATIIEKIFDFNDALPERFKAFIAW